MKEPAAASSYVVPADGNEEQCGGCARPGQLLCCDACPAAFHVQCAGYGSLDDVPDGEWLCWACALRLGKPFLHPRRPLACKAGDRVMVASASRKASVWPGKTANLGEVFHPATITRLEPGSVHVKYLPPAEGVDQLARSSERLWQGTTNTELAWTETTAGAFSPNARAFAIDIGRLQASLPAAQQPVQSAAAAPAVQLPLARPPAAALARPPAAPLQTKLPPMLPALPIAAVPARPSAAAPARPLAIVPITVEAVAAPAAAATAAPQQGASAPQLAPTPLAPAPTPAAAPAASPSPAAAATAPAAAAKQEAAQRSTPPTAINVANGEEAEPAGEEAFFAALLRYWEGRGRPLRLPIRFLKDKPLQLYVLWTQVMSFGGYEPVTSASLWATIGRALEPPPNATTVSYVTKSLYAEHLLDFEQATRQGLTGSLLPPATRDALEGGARSGRKPRQKKGLVAKPEPWMTPPRHVWTHEYRPASGVISVPAAKRRKLATQDPELQSPEAAADAAPAGSASPADSAAALATDAAAAPPLHRISSSGAGLTTAEAVAPANSHQRGAAKVAADAIPPLDPGLAAEELAGPVDRSEDADSLAAGDAVEVRPLAAGVRGAWLPATVLQVCQGSIAEGGRTFHVEYRDWVTVEEPSTSEASPPVVDAAAEGGPPPGDGGAAAPQQAGGRKRDQPEVGGQPGVKVREWVPLLSRVTLKAFPLVRLRRPRLPAPAGEAALLRPGDAVEAWCEGGWVAGRLAGTPEAPLVEVDEAPAGEGGTLEVPDRAAIRKAHPAVSWGHGMVAPLEDDHMLPRDRYRRWLRPKTYRLEGFPFETYACAEALPSNGYIASAAGDAAAAGSAAASPANSGAASGGYGTSGGSKRRRVASAFGGGGGTSGATSRLAARPGSAGPSRLANVSAFGGGEAGGGGGGDTAVHSAANAAGVAAPGAAAVPSTGLAFGAAAAAGPLPPRGPAAAAALGGGGCGAMLPSPGAAQSADDEDIDIDVGCEGPPGVNGSPLKAGPLAAAVLTAPHGGGRLMPVAVAAGGAAAAADFGQPHVVAEWLGAESMKRHQAARDVFVKTLAPQGSGDGDGKWSAEETRPEGRRVVGGRMRPQKADHAAYMRSRRAAQRGDGLPVNIRAPRSQKGQPGRVTGAAAAAFPSLSGVLPPKLPPAPPRAGPQQQPRQEGSPRADGGGAAARPLPARMFIPERSETASGGSRGGSGGGSGMLSDEEPQSSNEEDFISSSDEEIDAGALDDAVTESEEECPLLPPQAAAPILY